MYQSTQEIAKLVKESGSKALRAFQEIIDDAEKNRYFFYKGKSLHLFPSPVMLTREEHDRMGADAAGLLKLILSLPERLFQGDYVQMCRLFGFDEDQIEVMKITFGDNVGLIARADLYETNSGYQFLEFNVDSAVGGMEIGLLNQLMQQHDYFQALTSANWKFLDPMEHLVENIRNIGLSKGLNPDSMRVIMVDWYPDMLDYEDMHHIRQKQFEKYGLNLEVCSQNDVTLEGNRLMLRGKPIDLLYRTFLFADVKKETAKVKEMFRAYQTGNLVLANGMHTELFSNKANLALLSDPENWHLFSQQEIDLIQRCIPWTRMFKEGNTDCEGTRKELLRYVLEQREEMVLKPTHGFGGRDILLGWTIAPEEWEAQLRQILVSGAPYIVQKRVRPCSLTLPICTDTKVDFVESILNLGVYVFGDTYSGLLIRATPANGQQLVNVSQGAGYACAFYQDEVEVGTASL